MHDPRFDKNPEAKARAPRVLLAVISLVAFLVGLDTAVAGCNLPAIGEISISITPAQLFVCEGGDVTGTVSASVPSGTSGDITVSLSEINTGTGDVTITPTTLTLSNPSYAANYTVHGDSASSSLWDTKVKAVVTGGIEENPGDCEAQQDVTVIDFALLAIKFDHEGIVTCLDVGPDISTTDGLNIRQSYATDLQHADFAYAGEWVPLFGRNEPFLYVVGKDVTLKAKFAVSPHVDGTFSIRGDTVGMFPDVVPHAVTFVAGESVGDIDGYVEFIIDGKSHEFDGDSQQDVAKSSDSWLWSVLVNSSWCTFDTSGPHTCYAIYLPPSSAWYSTKERHPWVDALEHAIVHAGCDGDLLSPPAMSHVAQYCFSGLGKRYDRVTTAAHFGGGFSGASNFHLTSYLTHGGYVNCYDQACGTFLLGAVLGINPTYMRLSPFGYMDTAGLVGYGSACNNPIQPPGPLLVGSDDIYPDRQAFQKHAVVALGGAHIYDSTLGPHLGSLDIVGYANAAIDISSADVSSPYAERRLSPDSDLDGSLSAPEVASASGPGAVTGMD